MAVYSTSRFIAAIKKKGFVNDKTHHEMFWYYLDGRKTTVRTRTSHGEKEFNEGLMAKAAQTDWACQQAANARFNRMSAICRRFAANPHRKRAHPSARTKRICLIYNKTGG